MSTPSAAARGSLTAPTPGGLVFVVLAALCWGTSGVSGRIVADRTDLGPLDIAWHRMALGAVVLLAGYLLTRRRGQSPAVPLTRRLAVRLTLVAAGLAGYQLAYFAAVAAAGVSVATLVALGLAPLLIALGGTALGAGRPDRATSTALAAASAGGPTESKDPPRTRQSPLILAAVRPWGGSRGDAARGVCTHCRGNPARAGRTPRYRPCHDAPARPPPAPAALLTRSTAG